MIKPKFKWSWKNEEGSVSFPDGFDEQDWILKADALKDWICDLTDKYNSLMTKGYEVDEHGMGPLEYLFEEVMLAKGGGVDYTDFIGTAITLENIDEVAQRFHAAFIANNEDADGLQVTWMPVQ
jgi:hypothetical protein